MSEVRKVFYVDVGDMSVKELKETLAKIKKELENRKAR